MFQKKGVQFLLKVGQLIFTKLKKKKIYMGFSTTPELSCWSPCRLLRSTWCPRSSSTALRLSGSLKMFSIFPSRTNLSLQEQTVAVLQISIWQSWESCCCFFNSSLVQLCLLVLSLCSLKLGPYTFQSVSNSSSSCPLTLLENPNLDLPVSYLFTQLLLY